MTATDPQAAAYFAALKPKKGKLVFLGPSRCAGGLFDPGGGCNHVVPLVYMEGKVIPKFALCPVCGRRYYFAFWKLKGHDWKPNAEQEADIRALYRDMKRMCKGKEPLQGVTLEERVRLWCQRPAVCDAEGHAT